MAGVSTWHEIPCMYCSEPVGADGDTDDGEFYQCANCRNEAARVRQEVMRGYGEQSPLRRDGDRPREILCTLFGLVRSGVLAVPAGETIEVSSI